MTSNLLFDLDHTKKRLEYYEVLKSKNSKNKALDKWIEIYSERVTKLERQAAKVAKLGLRVQLKLSGVSSSDQARA